MNVDIFEYALKELDKHILTKSIRKRVEAQTYDRKLGEKICKIMFKICNENFEEYLQAIKYFIEFSVEFLVLQQELNREGKYKYSNFEEALKKVYENPEVMEKRYLNGLLLSQAFWINHQKMLEFFINNFCKEVKKKGLCMEIPTGTGIYISEFMNINPKWNLEGYDLSQSSIDFSKKVIKINSHREIPLHKKNVFNLEGKKYDKIICGELLEHLDNPEELLKKLKSILKEKGKLFLTTAIWAANIDHIYLFKSAQEVRDMLEKYFKIEKELVLNVEAGKNPADEKTPMTYACVLTKNLE